MITVLAVVGLFVLGMAIGAVIIGTIYILFEWIDSTETLVYVVKDKWRDVSDLAHRVW